MEASSGPGHIIYPKEIFVPALQHGAFTGIAGLLVGGASGVIRGSAPILFAGAAGVQWFALGSTFWATRTAILERDGVRNWLQDLRGAPLLPDRQFAHTPRDRTIASTAAGGITGGLIAALTRGRSNVVPGVIMFSLFGFGGQTVFNVVGPSGTEHTQEITQQAEKPKPENFLQWISTLKFSPMKSLSDDEYRKLIAEKKLALEAEIAIIDETIEKIKEESR